MEAPDTDRLVSYTPPTWAERLQKKPKYKVELANLNTPVQKWKVPGLPENFSLGIKRDDLTGGPLTGNKVRKLEFLLADALLRGYKHVCSAGFYDSNHVRAVAIAARELGLQPHALMMKATTDEGPAVPDNANLFLTRLVGARCYVTPTVPILELIQMLKSLPDKIEKKTGEKCYNIELGGSNSLSVFGYLEAFKELMAQGLLENYDDIVLAIGTGGTSNGLAIANYLTGSKIKIHGITIDPPVDRLHIRNNGILDSQGITEVRSEDIIDIIDGYKFPKTDGKLDQRLIDFVSKVASTTGIVIEQGHTAKAVYGLVEELRENPSRFQGNRVLYIHTGGIYSLFSDDVDGGAFLKDNGVMTWSDLV